MAAEDAPLITELCSRVPGLLLASQWEIALSAIRAAGYEVVKSGASSEPPDVSALYKRVQPKILAMLARLAPMNTPPTPELIAQVRAEILPIIVTELRAAGLDSKTADTIGHFMSAAIGVKRR